MFVCVYNFSGGVCMAGFLRFARDTLLAWSTGARREVWGGMHLYCRSASSSVTYSSGFCSVWGADFIPSGFMRPRALVIILCLRPVGLGFSLGRQGAIREHSSIRGCGLGV